jgi:hypothetical protein
MSSCSEPTWDRTAGHRNASAPQHVPRKRPSALDWSPLRFRRFRCCRRLGTCAYAAPCRAYAAQRTTPIVLTSPMDGSPQCGCVSTLPPYGTSMPQSGCRPPHQKRKGSNRAFHVRFAPDSGGRADIPDRQLGAMCGRHVAEYNLERKRTSSTSSLACRSGAQLIPILATRCGWARPGHACLWTDILNPL